MLFGLWWSLVLFVPGPLKSQKGSSCCFDCILDFCNGFDSNVNSGLRGWLIRKQGVRARKFLSIIGHNHTVSGFRGFRLLHWKDNIKSEMTSPLAEDWLITLMILMIINYHPGGAKHFNISSLILPATNKLSNSVFIPILHKKNVKGSETYETVRNREI